MILVLGGHNNDNGSVENDECYMSTLWNRSDWIRGMKFTSSTINGSKHSIVIRRQWKFTMYISDRLSDKDEADQDNGL